MKFAIIHFSFLTTRTYLTPVLQSSSSRKTVTYVGYQPVEDLRSPVYAASFRFSFLSVSFHLSFFFCCNFTTPAFSWHNCKITINRIALHFHWKIRKLLIEKFRKFNLEGIEEFQVESLVFLEVQQSGCFQEPGKSIWNDCDANTCRFVLDIDRQPYKTPDPGNTLTSAVVDSRDLPLAIPGILNLSSAKWYSHPSIRRELFKQANERPRKSLLIKFATEPCN